MKNQPEIKKEQSLFNCKPATTPSIHQLIAFVPAIAPVINQLPEAALLLKSGRKSQFSKSFLTLKQQLVAEWTYKKRATEVAGLARSIVFFNWKNYA